MVFLFVSLGVSFYDPVSILILVNNAFIQLDVLSKYMKTIG